MNEPAQQLDLGLGLPQRVDGADAIPQDDNEPADIEQADAEYIARLVDDTESERG